MFKLTRQEQALIIFILLSMLIGSAVKYYRRTHPQPAPNPITAPAGIQKPASQQPRSAMDAEH